MEQEEKKNLQEILDRYRYNKLSRREKFAVFGWLARLNLSGKQSERVLPEHQQMRSWQALEPKLYPEHKSSQLFFRPWPTMVAASVMALVVIGSWFYGGDRHDRGTIPWETHITDAGETKRVMLPDGSSVILNSESRFSFPVSFGRDSRIVKLEGQGFFEVAHDPLKPFRVETDLFTVKVLGTSFDVKDYTGDADARIGVTSGSVGVVWETMGSHPGEVLKSGDQLRYRKGGRLASVTRIDTADASAWRQRRLSYRNEPLSVISKDLERHFGIRIIFTNPAIAEQKFSLDARSPQLFQIIEALSISGDIHHELKGNQLTLW